MCMDTSLFLSIALEIWCALSILKIIHFNSEKSDVQIMSLKPVFFCFSFCKILIRVITSVPSCDFHSVLYCFSSFSSGFILLQFLKLSPCSMSILFGNHACVLQTFFFYSACLFFVLNIVLILFYELNTSFLSFSRKYFLFYLF